MLRSTTPLVVAVVDGIFRPYAAVFPSPKTWVSLVRDAPNAASPFYLAARADARIRGPASRRQLARTEVSSDLLHPNERLATFPRLSRSS